MSATHASAITRWINFLTGARLTDEPTCYKCFHRRALEGISIERMKSWLPDYHLVSRRSYGFFGPLSSSLPPALRSEEEQLIRDGALEGEYVAAAWRLRA